MSIDLSQVEILVRVAGAMFLGAMIGFEREVARKPAGLRTHMLVAGVAALIVSLGDLIVHNIDTKLADGLISSDPLRVLGAVITGVSFLGAGTIIRAHNQRDVEGLTTAASVLLASCLGICVAVAQYQLAVGATLFALFTLWIVGMGERYLERKFLKHSGADKSANDGR